MAKLVRRRNPPFALAAGVVLVATIAYFRLPDALVVQIEHHTIASGPNGNWIYRILAVAAALQAIYAGTVLRPERIKRSLPTGPAPRAVVERVYVSATRTAAGAIPLTLVYGLAAFFITGGRASTWLFVAMMVAQGAWYYRQLGRLAAWLELQPAPAPEPPAWSKPRPEPRDFAPPLARGMRIPEDEATKEVL